MLRTDLYEFYAAQDTLKQATPEFICDHDAAISPVHAFNSFEL
jgi:hypothetical protein